ncbi:hypothetical protein AO391_04200 [Pseudomonas marginalis ICMP 9505]|nr:hypothetical protein AO391_04200 [Pseudomonas marginalis ICMP 9505]RMP65620.1 hypothetical protein ALQ18_04083 [Pseudomonas marginalis pv. marginalis]
MCVSHSEALWLWPGFCNHLGTPAEFLMEWLKQIKSAFVGAGLLAIAVYQISIFQLTHRIASKPAPTVLTEFGLGGGKPNNG